MYLEQDGFEKGTIIKPQGLTILLCASPHGFGHAARNIPIVQALIEREDVAKVIIKTAQAQGAFMRDVIGAHEKVSYELDCVDIGLVLKDNSMDIDGVKLEQTIRDYISSWDDYVAREVVYLTDHHVDLVICDIVPWYLIAAQQANVKSVLISNFTWIEIYQEYLPCDIIETFKDCYQLADHVVLYDLANDFCRDFFKTYDEVSLCARDFDDTAVANIKAQHKQPLVFVSVGRSVDIKTKMDVSQLPYDFIVTEGIELAGDNVFYLPKETQNTHDYVKASNFVITKAGFGTVAEALLAQAKCAVIGRDTVAEDRETIRQLVNRHVAVEVKLTEKGLDFTEILNVLERFEPKFKDESFSQDAKVIAGFCVKYANPGHHLLTFERFGNTEAGYLVPVDQVPFEVKRLFYLVEVPQEAVRGAHAYVKTKQVLICVTGSVTVHCDGVAYVLNDSSKGLYVEPHVWREAYDFSEGAVLLALCSEVFSEEDYLR